MFKVGYGFKFSAAHHLPNYEGVCQFQHGHSFHVVVEVAANTLINDMVVDFKLLADIVNDKIIGIVDHKDLNEVLTFTPTAENLAQWIHSVMHYNLVFYYGVEVHITKVTVYEEDNTYAIYEE
jgi:6-pyruvoyltetrahydropterin/6-carboxytetrahydropterin synthase